MYKEFKREELEMFTSKALALTANSEDLNDKMETCNKILEGDTVLHVEYLVHFNRLADEYKKSLSQAANK